jgi:outer membrane protein assembly factor BamB
MRTVHVRRRTKTILLLAGLGLAGAGLLAAPADTGQPGNWPQFRGPNRDNLSSDTGLLTQWDAAGPALAWKATGLGLGFSSVAVTRDRIYTMGDLGSDQYVIALSATDGKLLWKTRIGPNWQDRYPGPRATPTVDGDRLYTLGTEGDLVSLDAATGKERWRKNLATDFGGAVMSDWKFSESPLVDGDRVVVTPGAQNAALVALDKMTGATIWKAALPPLGPKGRDGCGYASIVISNGGGVKQYVQMLGRGLVGIRAADGAFLWNYNKVANDVANIPTAALKGDFVFASTGYQAGAALLKLAAAGAGKVTATEVYFLEGRTFQNHHGGFVLVGDSIYAGNGHRNGLPICIDLATGQVRWGGNIRNEGIGSAALTYADGHVYYRYENGVMILVEATPQAYRQKGIFKLPTGDQLSWAYPVVTGGKLYVRDKDTLLVYDVKKT